MKVNWTGKKFGKNEKYIALIYITNYAKMWLNIKHFKRKRISKACFYIIIGIFT